MIDFYEDRRIVMVSTRHFYQSYSDLHSLQELAEFPQCYSDEVELDAGNIFIHDKLNGDVQNHLDARRDRYEPGDPSGRSTLVFWNLERGEGAPDSAGPWLDTFDLIWVSDRAWWKKLRAGHPGNEHRFRLVPVGSDRRLADGRTYMEQDSYDVCHFSYEVHRRSLIYNALRAKGIRVANNAWGQRRADILSSSRAMLNVGQDEIPHVEPLRWALAAAWGMPILSEYREDQWPQILDVSFWPYGHLVEGVIKRMEHGDGLELLGRNTQRILCDEIGFRGGIEREVSGEGWA